MLAASENRRFQYVGAIAEVAVALVGAMLLGTAIAANRRYLDHHLVPSFLLPNHWFVVLETLVRSSMAVIGTLLVFVVRTRAGRFVAQRPARVIQIVVSILLGIGASELALRRVHLGSAEWLLPNEEPRRQPDTRLGWTWVPERSGYKSVGGRIINYAIDRQGYRVNSVEEPVDPDRPTILFTGESVMFGEGLTWQESIPAQVGAMLGLQTANLAVHGYGNDQAYLKLESDLPHFRRPVAVVSLFMPTLFGRNLDGNRPHLGPGLVWSPAERRSRLAVFAKLLVPYRAQATIERGIEITREVFCATGNLALARGTISLLVVIQFEDEGPPEEILRRRVLENLRVPYIIVKISSAWRIPWDRHPDARAAHEIAAAIAADFQREWTGWDGAAINLESKW